jgi:hypothetical protein
MPEAASAGHAARTVRAVPRSHRTLPGDRVGLGQNFLGVVGPPHRVCDEHVQAIKACNDSRLDRRGLREIQWDAEPLTPGSLDLGRHAIRCVEVGSVAEGHLGPLAPKGDRRRPPDSRGAAGDEHSTIEKLEIHCNSQRL